MTDAIEAEIDVRATTALADGMMKQAQRRDIIQGERGYKPVK
jgi:hypothetical protein